MVGCMDNWVKGEHRASEIHFGDLGRSSGNERVKHTSSTCLQPFLHHIYSSSYSFSFPALHPSYHSCLPRSGWTKLANFLKRRRVSEACFCARLLFRNKLGLASSSLPPPHFHCHFCWLNPSNYPNVCPICSFLYLLSDLTTNTNVIALICLLI